MSNRYTADGKRKSSMVHAKRVRECACGRICRGNGGWSSHKRVCFVYKKTMARRPEEP